MDIRAIDARGTAWEQEHDRYRVCFRDRSAVTAHEHEVLEGVDVDDLLTWGSVYAAERGWGYTIYVSTTDGDTPGLIRLAGVQGDPFVDA
jgi:hypothetical protein